MKEEIEVITHTNVDLSNSMLIVAFPTVGLVSVIAGRFIDLEEIGSGIPLWMMVIESPYNAPATDRMEHAANLRLFFQSLCLPGS